MLLSSYIGKDPLPAEAAAGLRLSKNSEIFRHRKGRSLRKKPIRGVFRLQSQVFQNFLVLKNRTQLVKKGFFDKLRPAAG